MLSITRSGLELRKLIERQWYWISVKADVFLPPSIIHFDQEKDQEYCKHSDFTDWLRDEECKEAHARDRYDEKHGEYRSDWTLLEPHKFARRVFGLPV